jgi:hypothetical protein
VLDPGNGQPLSVSFTPSNTADYNLASSSVSINVVFNPAGCIAKSVTGPPSIGACGMNTSASSASITGSAGGLTYQNNTVGGSLTVTNNTGGVHIGPGNKTTGPATIKNNT